MASLKKSPWIIHYDGSSCNGCDIEMIACLTPVYDIERLGALNMGNPKHADIFLITGAINDQNRTAVRNLYEQMPDPKAVVAIGTCATSGGIFRECYNVGGGVDEVIPVDVYVPGCAARPELIIDGIKRALDILAGKYDELSKIASGARKIHIERVFPGDIPEIHALQKLAYRSEAEIYSDETIPAMIQDLAQLEEDYREKTFFKATIGVRIEGSVRVFIREGTCFASRLMVNPVYQHHGIGRKLMEHAEKYFTEAKRIEIDTFHKSRRNIVFYEGLGYKVTRREKISEKTEKVYMQKILR